METDNVDAVWAALGSPERRRILDRLRDGPALTGDLTDWLVQCGYVGSRFATQRHLKVLREAGLVLVTARGRQRVNALNAAALYRATIGWLDPVSRGHASGLDRLKRHLENPERKDQAMDIRHFDVHQRIDIAVSPTEVYDALTDDVTTWWGAPYQLIDDQTVGQPRFAIPRKVGEAVVETRGDKQALWGVVSRAEPDREIGWVGQMGMGSATYGEVRFRLESTAAGTTVHLDHEAFGAIDDTTVASYDYGWDDLLHRLAAHLVDGRDYGVAGENREPDGFVHN